MKHRINFSIIVVSHNEGDLLRRTIESFLENSNGCAFELVVVDDQSTDGSTDFLTQPGWAPARLVKTAQRLGISAARNLGAAESNGDVIVFSDAHVSVPANWAEPLYLAAVKPFVGAVAPTISSLHEPHIKGYGFTWRDASLKMHWLRRSGTVEFAVPFLCGCFIAMRRSVFELAGGFDEGLIRWGSEDAELSLRLWKLGYECHVVPSVTVAHLFRKHFPYEVGWELIIHNSLRLATVHFGERALASVVRHYSANVTFPGAAAKLCLGDSWRRRETLLRSAVIDDTTLFKRFQIDALT